jgi:lambda family phage tail tape measure protein
VASQQLRQITIKVQSSGDGEIKKIASSLSGLSKSVKSMSGDLGFLTNAFTGLFAAIGIRELTSLSDEMQQLGDRVNIFTGNADETAKVMAEIGAIATRTKTSIGNIGTTYSRVAVAAKEAGLSSEQLLVLTETLQNTFRLSGATTEEAAGATVQFSQALARGQLRGQELISVLSQNAFYANLLSDSLGVTRGKLLKMAEAGELTTNKVLTPLFDNMDKVNAQARQLSTTFGQSMTLAINAAAKAADNLNKKFDISGSFARNLEAYTSNIDALSVAIGSLAVLAIPKLLMSLAAMATAMGPLGIAIAGITAGLSALGLVISKYLADYGTFGNAVDVLSVRFREAYANNNIWLKSILGIGQTIPILKEFLTVGRLVADLDLLPAGNTLARANRDLLADRKRLDYEKETKVSAPKFKDTLEFNLLLAIKELNRQYDIGIISVSKYYESIRKLKETQLDKDFAEGKVELAQYLTTINEFRRAGLYEEFRKAEISLQEFNAGIEANKLEELNIKLQANTISLKEFDAQLVEISNKFNPGSSFRVGVEQYVSSIGSLNKQIADVFTTAFKQSENLLLEFNQTGNIAADSWRNFGRVILEELNRIIIRMYVLKPLLEGLTGFIGGGVSASDAYQGQANPYAGTSQPFAKGGAFNKGVRMFARGGIVDSPTLFSYGNSKTGMMGEAGTEAILPLSRGRGGDLGVSATVTPVVVNINNNANVDVTQSDRVGPNGERVIELLIQAKVRDALTNGSMDKTMKTAYGITRKGT